MAECEFLASCDFRGQMLRCSLEFAKDLEEAYCKGEYSQCAGHTVASVLGSESVPAALFPFETARAARIVQEQRNA